MTGPALSSLGAFVFCLTVILANMNSSLKAGGSLDEFEVGKVADRDVVSDKAISYEDETATRLRREAQERLVPAVFLYSPKASDEIQNKWKRFAALAENRLAEDLSLDAFKLALESDFPGDFSGDVLDRVYRFPRHQELLDLAGVALASLLTKGIYSLPRTGLERLNPDVAELIRQSGNRIEQERIPYTAITTRENAGTALKTLIAAGSYPAAAAGLLPELLEPFFGENVFYSLESTARNTLDIRAKVEPVMNYIEQGKRVIKKGFIITDEDMEELRALKMSLPGSDIRNIFAVIIFLLLFFGFLAFFSGRRIAGRNLTDRESYLVCGFSALYIAGSVLIRNIPFGAESIPSSLVFPTALVVMLSSILIHPRLALMLALSLPVGSFITDSFDSSSFVFALVSGAAASYSLQGAEKRMDLLKAGLLIALANVTVMTALLLWQRSSAGAYPQALSWAAFNGIASGMLVLGLLPPLEHALNAATVFRLIELSDLNAPILRRLFTVTPGTYSHSIMVANLAEAACQDIGANPLLARVGAYYHDLGKMENPDYFVENQTDHNRHDDIAPRLSATVIRSHVKLGIEKARQLGLPREVTDIIAEHHGNSVITWFYNKALKQEGEDVKKGAVNMEDFTYPGNPPRSRESAVVMLADVTEAAVRTLDKPTVVKMEKFIQELFAQKVEHGQLARSELTFRDLETIKNAFVRVLAGYYHSRIEYPKLPRDIPSGTEAAKGKAE
jgi:putative nucleotidyltransferase with HDIG domain